MKTVSLRYYDAVNLGDDLFDDVSYGGYMFYLTFAATTIVSCNHG